MTKLNSILRHVFKDEVPPEFGFEARKTSFDTIHDERINLVSPNRMYYYHVVPL
jgi:hypothetical protein